MSHDLKEFMTGFVRMTLDWKEFVAGGAGGIAGIIVGKPFDTVKVRLQIKPEKFNNSAIQCVKHIHTKEGARGFYKGVMSPISGAAFVNAIVFGVYGNVLNHITNDTSSLAANYIAGFAAGAAQTPICCVVELIRIRMETDNLRKNPKYTGTYDCLAKTMKRDGIRGLFRGFNCTLLREAPCFGVCFVSYEWITRQMKKYCNLKRDAELGTLYVLMAGGIAGTLTWFSTYPIDVLKTRIQEPETPKFKGVVDCFKHSYRAEGWRSLFRGLAPCLARAFPVNAATFAVYEATKRML